MLKKQYAKNKPVCQVTFSLPKEAAGEAREVRILGEFNDWNWEAGEIMKPAKNGEFQATMELLTGRDYQFRYLIDNHIWENDWDADGYVPTPFGVFNSVIKLEKVAIAEAEAKPKEKKTTTKKPVAGAAKPAKDDLKKIEGIGPKIEKLLNGDGIHTFDDLAKAGKTALSAILEKAGPRYKMHDPSTWAEQAKLAAKGDWDKLMALQEELKGGKR